SSSSLSSSSSSYGGDSFVDTTWDDRRSFVCAHQPSSYHSSFLPSPPSPHSHLSTSSFFSSPPSFSSKGEEEDSLPNASLLLQDLARDVGRSCLRFLRLSEIGLRSAFLSLSRPTEDQHIATLSEVLFFTSHALYKMHRQMWEHPDGRRVLEEKPLLNSRSLSYPQLRRLPSHTVGYAYMQFMDKNELHAGARQPVRLVEDPGLAYVLTRYRQLHDFMHTLYGMDISVEEEVALKLIEFYQTLLPMTFLASLFGSLAAPVVRADFHKPPHTEKAPLPLLRELSSSLSSSFSVSNTPSSSSPLHSHPRTHSCREHLEQQVKEEEEEEKKKEKVGEWIYSYEEEDKLCKEERGERNEDKSLQNSNRQPASTSQTRGKINEEEEDDEEIERLLQQSEVHNATNPYREVNGAVHIMIKEGEKEETKKKKKAIVYPRHELLTQLLPWAIQAGRAVKVPLHCVYIEEWLDRPLEELRQHCGVLLPPSSSSSVH
ncbi:ubiquinone biosynthesis protein, partial [Cystoisospora suis]